VEEVGEGVGALQEEFDPGPAHQGVGHLLQPGKALHQDHHRARQEADEEDPQGYPEEREEEVFGEGHHREDGVHGEGQVHQVDQEDHPPERLRRGLGEGLPLGVVAEVPDHEVDEVEPPEDLGPPEPDQEDGEEEGEAPKEVGPKQAVEEGPGPEVGREGPHHHRQDQGVVPGEQDLEGRHGEKHQEVLSAHCGPKR